MAFNVNITVRNQENIQKLANLVARIVESATGSRVILRLHDRSKLTLKENNERKEVQRKLLK